MVGSGFLRRDEMLDCGTVVGKYFLKYSPCWNLNKFGFFRGDQKILMTFYNDDQWQKSSMNQ